MSDEKPKKGGRKKGHPKTGGRQKGTPNKNSFSARLALDSQGFNLMEEMVALYGELKDVDKKLSFLRWLAEFVYPRRSEVEDEPTKDPLEGKTSQRAHSVPLAQLLSIASKKDA